MEEIHVTVRSELHSTLVSFSRVEIVIRHLAE